jgi:hypothetical protein
MNKFNLETKVDELPLAKFRKIRLINTICFENGKSYKTLTISDLSRFSVIDGELFHNKGYLTKVANVGKVCSSEIAPCITLSKVLKKKGEHNDCIYNKRQS